MAHVWKLTPAQAGDRRPEPIPLKAGGAPDPAGPLHWPACASCGAPMAFLFQLAPRPGQLALVPGIAAVYVFQCENPATACEAWDPDSGANRAVAVAAGIPSIEGRARAGGHLPTPMAIHPAEEDSAALAIDLDTAPFEELARRDKAAAAAPGSKLGGVPVWLQGPATPRCCGLPMDFVAQLDGETWSLPFGDDGRGFLFQCATPCATPYKFLWQAG